MVTAQHTTSSFALQISAMPRPLEQPSLLEQQEALGSLEPAHSGSLPRSASQQESDVQSFLPAASPGQASSPRQHHQRMPCSLAESPSSVATVAAGHQPPPQGSTLGFNQSVGYETRHLQGLIEGMKQQQRADYDRLHHTLIQSCNSVQQDVVASGSAAPACGMPRSASPDDTSAALEALHDIMGRSGLGKRVGGFSHSDAATAAALGLMPPVLKVAKVGSQTSEQAMPSAVVQHVQVKQRIMDKGSRIVGVRKVGSRTIATPGLPVAKPMIPKPRGGTVRISGAVQYRGVRQRPWGKCASTPLLVSYCAPSVCRHLYLHLDCIAPAGCAAKAHGETLNTHPRHLITLCALYCLLPQCPRIAQRLVRCPMSHSLPGSAACHEADRWCMASQVCGGDQGSVAGQAPMARNV
jgi:hypothetical protein